MTIGGGGASAFGLGGAQMPGVPQAPSDGSSPRVRLGQMGKSGRGTYAKFDAKAPAIMGGLMDKYGLTKEQAAGVLGNLGHESARFTAYHEGGKVGAKGGVGWAQWTGPRRHAFERWTAARGLDPTSDEASWRYLTEGDPETAKAIAAVKRTNSVNGAMTTFEHKFERSADYNQRTGAILKPGSVASRLSLAQRAYGMHEVHGSQDGPATPAVPAAVADRARRTGKAAGPQASAGGKAGGHSGVQVASLQIHVHPAKGHSEKDIADAVHSKFNGAVRNHLSDGAFA